jgi:hypothetical protein
MDRVSFAQRFGPALARAQRQDAYNAEVKRRGEPEPPIFKTVMEDFVNARGAFEHIDDYAKDL